MALDLNIISNQIEEQTTLNMMQKAAVKRGLDMLEADRAMLSKLSACIYKGKSPIQYVKFDERFVIVELLSDDSKFYEGNKTHFQTVDLEKNGTISMVSFSLEDQMLITLGYKYDGANSQFVRFAKNMLEIK